MSTRCFKDIESAQVSELVRDNEEYKLQVAASFVANSDNTTISVKFDNRLLAIR